MRRSTFNHIRQDPSRHPGHELIIRPKAQTGRHRSTTANCCYALYTWSTTTTVTGRKNTRPHCCRVARWRPFQREKNSADSDTNARWCCQQVGEQARKDKRDKETKKQIERDKRKRTTQPLDTRASAWLPPSLPVGLYRFRGFLVSLIRPPLRFARSYAVSTICTPSSLFPRHGGSLNSDISSSRILHQEVDYGVKIGLFLGRDAIAADLAALNGLEV